MRGKMRQGNSLSNARQAGCDWSLCLTRYIVAVGSPRVKGGREKGKEGEGAQAYCLGKTKMNEKSVF